ncbi:IFI27 [Cervus elaphus hippelaphus]|uniref:IFI27 n=1 Tax=Cervus elaphus hippelaphus TaxID=46360 RepID=A0A212CS76_CEREH|nr:IFI27 [Cervus elaphus hippelaphus]
MEFTKVAFLASKLASKILSAGSLAKVGGAASSSILAGLPSLGLTLPSSAALAGATSTLGSLVGTLKGSFLLGSPAVALGTLPVGAKAAVAVVGGGMTAAAVIGGVMAVRAVPELLDTMGFTRTGISRSSVAANMMSSTARANGGRVPSGSLVSNLQSKGATGLSTPSNILLGSAGALLGALLWNSSSSSRRTQY